MTHVPWGGKSRKVHAINNEKEKTIWDYDPDSILSSYKKEGFQGLEKIGMPDHVIIQALTLYVYQRMSLSSASSNELKQSMVRGLVAEDLCNGEWPLERVVEAVMKKGGNRGHMELLVGEVAYLRRYSGPVEMAHIRQLGKEVIEQVVPGTYHCQPVL